MLEPVIDSNSWFLSFLWTITNSLIVGSVLALSIIFVRRVIEDKQEEKNVHIRDKLSRFINVVANSPVKFEISDLPKLSSKERPLVVSVALDALRSQEGNGLKDIIELLTLWDTPSFLIDNINTKRKGRVVQYLTLLSYFSGQREQAVLEEYAKDDDIYVQIAALSGLARQGVSFDRIELILDTLVHAKQTNSLLLTEVLSKFKEEARPTIERLAKEAETVEVRSACIMTLGEKHYLDSVEFLITLLHDPNPNIKARISTALGLIGDRRAGGALIDCLSHNNLGVRVQAIHALGRIGYSEAMPDLIKGLEDSSWWARYRTAEALYNMGDKGIALLKALSFHKNLTGETCTHYLAEKESEYA